MDELHRRTGTPKSSLRRILDTLSDLGCVERGAEMKYRGRVRLLPAEASAEGPEARIGRMLDELVERTGVTAEWFVPTEAGMILARRAAPPEGELHVRARIGFVRHWRGEMDAVAAVGHACFGTDLAVASDAEPFWCYDAAGQRRPVAPEEVARRVQAARAEGSSADEHFNPNGVRRMAALVRMDGRPLGIAALAEHLRPGGDRRAGHMVALKACSGDPDAGAN